MQACEGFCGGESGEVKRWLGLGIDGANRQLTIHNDRRADGTLGCVARQQKKAEKQQRQGKRGRD